MSSNDFSRTILKCIDINHLTVDLTSPKGTFSFPVWRVSHWILSYLRCRSLWSLVARLAAIYASSSSSTTPQSSIVKCSVEQFFPFLRNCSWEAHAAAPGFDNGRASSGNVWREWIISLVGRLFLKWIFWSLLRFLGTFTGQEKHVRQQWLGSSSSFTGVSPTIVHLRLDETWHGSIMIQISDSAWVMEVGLRP